MCSAIGRLRIGTIGLGISHVRGLSLVPEPPAIKTARIIPPYSFAILIFCKVNRLFNIYFIFIFIFKVTKVQS